MKCKMEVYQQFDVDNLPPACNCIKNESPAQLFFHGFFKIFKNTYFAEHLRKADSNDIIISRFFCKIYCSSK